VALVSRRSLLATLAAVPLLALAAPAAASGGWDRLLAPPGTCGAQEDRGATVRAQERAMRCLINFARRSEGTAPLRARGKRLAKAADRKAADILRCGEFSHTACGRPFTYHMQATAYAAGCYGAGENIAWGSGQLGTVRSIMRSWLASDGHRANLLNAEFRDHGVALRTGSLSGHDGAAVWVHQLGYHC
jgi:uncharacterized protein YkwD